MAYTLQLQCGCFVDVFVHPITGLPRTRVVRTRGVDCITRRHAVGVEVGLFDPARPPAAAVRTDDERQWLRAKIDLDLA